MTPTSDHIFEVCKRLGVSVIKHHNGQYMLSKRGKARAVLLYPKAKCIIVEFKGSQKKRFDWGNIRELILIAKDHIKMNEWSEKK